MLALKQTTVDVVRIFIANQISVHTRLAYSKDLVKLKEFLRRDGVPLECATLQLLIRFRETLRDEYSSATVSRVLSTTKAFYNYLEAHHDIKNPAKGLKCGRVNSNETGTFSDDEVIKILDAAKNNQLHSLVLHLLFFMGLRRSEVVGLRTEDIRETEGITTLRILGKGDKVRTLPIPPVVIRVLFSSTKYLALCPSPENPKKAIHVNSVTKILKKYCVAVGITRKVSPHCCRTTWCSNARENGADLIQVEQAGGWSGFKMVSLYDKRKKDIKNSAIWSVNYERPSN